MRGETFCQEFSIFIGQRRALLMIFQLTTAIEISTVRIVMVVISRLIPAPSGQSGRFLRLKTFGLIGIDDFPMKIIPEQ